MGKTKVILIFDYDQQGFNEEVNTTLDYLQRYEGKIIDIKHSVSSCRDNDELPARDTFSALILYEEKEE